MAEIPLVVIDVQRPGPVTGLPTRTEQSDLKFVISASQGEFPRMVIALRNPSDAFYQTMGPHRLNAASRPAWFFKHDQYGGILCDIGSHQIEQFLYYTGANDATVVSCRAVNQAHPEYPELEDFGDCTLIADNGASGYFRVDWFTPDGLPTWGDGRTFILGTEGFIELRKYVDLCTDRMGGRVYLANGKETICFDVTGKVGYPFFGQLILDCLNRTENAMEAEHLVVISSLKWFY